MTSRERVRMALNHNEADRVPIDLGGTCVTTMITTAYNKLREQIGIQNGFARMHNFAEQLGYPEREFMKRFPFLDVVAAGTNFMKSDEDWKEFPLSDGSKCLIPKFINLEEEENRFLLKDDNDLVLAIKPKDSLYVRQTYWPWKGLTQIPDDYDIGIIYKNMWATPLPPLHLNVFNEYQYQLFIKNIKELHETTDYAISLLVGCGLFEPAIFIRGLVNLLCDLVNDKKRVKNLFDLYLENHLRFLDRVLQGVGEHVDILIFSDDMGHNDGPWVSPDTFNEIFKPRYQRMYDFVHENSNCKIFLHSCGSIMEIIPGLIDAGLDILNPVQTNARNMDPVKLKKEYGKYLTFWGGGVDTRHVLPAKTPEEVKEDVKKRIEILGKDGGFVFAAIHNIQSDCPPENIIAMLEAAYEFGFYSN